MIFSNTKVRITRYEVQIQKEGSFCLSFRFVPDNYRDRTCTFTTLVYPSFKTIAIPSPVQSHKHVVAGLRNEEPELKRGHFDPGRQPSDRFAIGFHGTCLLRVRSTDVVFK